MAISIEDIKKLRAMTGASLLSVLTVRHLTVACSLRRWALSLL